uniref:Major facilitator superfamily (MFS) profile domain-containing protein n=1 Tax=Scylla olivacea TaxID=85551 RepID=A0A0P4WSH5_SCYOL
MPYSTCHSVLGGIVCHLADNVSFHSQDGEFVWEAELQERLRSAFSWGFLLTQLVAGRLAGILGGKLLLLLGVALAAVLTLLIPAAALVGPYWLLAARIMIGAAQVSFDTREPHLTLGVPRQSPSVFTLISSSLFHK